MIYSKKGIGLLWSKQALPCEFSSLWPYGYINDLGQHFMKQNEPHSILDMSWDLCASEVRGSPPGEPYRIL